MPNPIAIALGIVFVLLGIGVIINSVIGGATIHSTATTDLQRSTIEAMDKTIRAQWEVQRILYGRLGEKAPPPPVSITGLPDPLPPYDESAPAISVAIAPTWGKPFQLTPEQLVEVEKAIRHKE